MKPGAAVGLEYMKTVSAGTIADRRASVQDRGREQDST